MIADTLPLPSVPDFLGHIQNRLLRDFSAAVEEWADCLRLVTEWEDEHLLDDEPAPALLAAHKATLERMLAFGQFISLAAAHPDFPEKVMAEIVASTMQSVRDKLAMWHGTMTRTEADALLQQVFGES